MVALGNSSLGANEAQSRSRPVSVPVWVFFRVRANVRVWGWAESTIVLWCWHKVLPSPQNNELRDTLTPKISLPTDWRTTFAFVCSTVDEYIPPQRDGAITRRRTRTTYSTNEFFANIRLICLYSCEVCLLLKCAPFSEAVQKTVVSVGCTLQRKHANYSTEHLWHVGTLVDRMRNTWSTQINIVFVAQSKGRS